MGLGISCIGCWIKIQTIAKLCELNCLGNRRFLEGKRLLVVTGFLVPLRVTRSGSVFSLILLTFRNIHNVKLSFANVA